MAGKQSKAMTGTKVLSCDCANEFQDRTYGNHMRLHNASEKPSPGWRCTVCERKKS